MRGRSISAQREFRRGTLCKPVVGKAINEIGDGRWSRFNRHQETTAIANLPQCVLQRAAALQVCKKRASSGNGNIRGRLHRLGITCENRDRRIALKRQLQCFSQWVGWFNDNKPPPLLHRNVGQHRAECNRHRASLQDRTAGARFDISQHLHEPVDEQAPLQSTHRHVVTHMIKRRLAQETRPVSGANTAETVCQALQSFLIDIANEHNLGDPFGEALAGRPEQRFKVGQITFGWHRPAVTFKGSKSGILQRIHTARHETIERSVIAQLCKGNPPALCNFRSNIIACSKHRSLDKQGRFAWFFSSMIKNGFINDRCGGRTALDGNGLIMK